MNKNDILNAYQSRHACKEFDANNKISADDWSFLLDTIRLSPSSFGLQPYEVLVIENQDVLNELRPYVWGGQKQLPTASKTVLFVTKRDVTVDDEYFSHIVRDIQDTPSELLAMRKDLVNNHQLQQIKIGEDIRYLDDWAAKQAYIALGNVMTAAAMIGIDSCPIEGFVRDEVEKVLHKNNIIDFSKYQLAVFCCFGYRLTDPARAKTRKPLTELVRNI
ncbi:MAG: NAD(P)H-dependent oxidoreductase [Proteobacteria bacterium]|nr:MAG: NAD(P)H-dependent oxidoreductase [Pseudomonadota bacterium]